MVFSIYVKSYMDLSKVKDLARQYLIDYYILDDEQIDDYILEIYGIDGVKIDDIKDMDKLKIYEFIVQVSE